MAEHVAVEIRWHRHPLTISAEARQRAEMAVTKALADIENLAKQRVRVDTGNLKNSIASEREGDLAGSVGPRSVEYALPQEYGTFKMTGQPYMRPAAEIVQPQFVAAMEQIIG